MTYRGGRKGGGRKGPPSIGRQTGVNGIRSEAESVPKGPNCGWPPTSFLQNPRRFAGLRPRNHPALRRKIVREANEKHGLSHDSPQSAQNGPRGRRTVPSRSGDVHSSSQNLSRRRKEESERMKDEKVAVGWHALTDVRREGRGRTSPDDGSAHGRLATQAARPVPRFSTFSLPPSSFPPPLLA